MDILVCTIWYPAVARIVPLLGRVKGLLNLDRWSFDFSIFRL